VLRCGQSLLPAGKTNSGEGGSGCLRVSVCGEAARASGGAG